jgi:hypothetical protein
MTEYHELKHPRKVSNITDGEIAIFGSSDGGTTWYPVKVDDEGRLNFLGGLVPHNYDYIALSYTGDNLTGVVYRDGGASGTIVARLSLTYDVNDNLATVTKT